MYIFERHVVSSEFPQIWIRIFQLINIWYVFHVLLWLYEETKPLNFASMSYLNISRYMIGVLNFLNFEYKDCRLMIPLILFVIRCKTWDYKYNSKRWWIILIQFPCHPFGKFDKNIKYDWSSFSWSCFAMSWDFKI